jgi:hypothetical protein
MPISSILTSKDTFVQKQHWDYSNKLLEKLKNSISASIDFKKSFNEILKNQGLTLLSLDPMESQLQLFHHPQIIGRSWTSSDRKVVAALGFDSDAKPVQLVPKSIKYFKSFPLNEFAKSMDEDNDQRT